MNPNSSFLSGDKDTLDPGGSNWLPHIALLRFKLVCLDLWPDFGEHREQLQGDINFDFARTS